MPSRTKWLVRLLWALFVVRGIASISFLPLWEGFDEWGHYAAIQQMALHGWAAGRSDKVSKEVEASLKLVPGGFGSPLKYDDYWRLPPADRRAREEALQSIPIGWAAEVAAGGPKAYELQQAPLYYWTIAGLYRAIAQLPLLTRVWILRLAGLLLASMIVPLGFTVARTVMGDDPRALGCIALVVAMPQVTILVARIGNDCLAIPMGAFLSLAVLRWKRDPRSMSAAMGLGGALGLALLTKAYFLSAVAPVMILLLIRAKQRGAAREALAAASLSAAISAWWYIGNWVTTHSLTGEQIGIAARSDPLALAVAAVHMSWLRAGKFILLSHLWLGNWSFLEVRSWMYQFFELFALLSVIGLVLTLARRRTQPPSRGDLLALASLFAALAVAVAYDAVQIFEVQGGLGTFGYYLLGFAAAEAVLVVTGLEAVAPRAFAPAVAAAGVVCLTALDFFGAHFYALPYYTGLTVRAPDDRLPALRLSQLGSGGLRTMVERLSVNKPVFLSPPVMAALLLLLEMATVCLVLVAVLVAADRYKRRADAANSDQYGAEAFGAGFSTKS